METLSAVFPYVIGLALAAVVAALAVGIVAMVRGGEFNKKQNSKPPLALHETMWVV